MKSSINSNESYYLDALNADSSEVSELDRFLKPSGLFSLGEACIRGEVSPHNIEKLISSLISTNRLPSSIGIRTILTGLGTVYANRQSGKRAYVIAKRHYDLGNDLFSQMLDKSMSYTCGYWKNATDLESAQTAKLEVLCKKLKLTKGMCVLDIGCGWGNFAYHAAINYGVTVVGLTISKEQAEYARKRCAGLPVEILLQSYENFQGTFDRVVSIEMIEAVGKRNLQNYFSFISKSLKPGGLAAIQAISGDTFNKNSHRALNQYVMWLLKHIFPNGYLPNLDELMSARRSGLILEDIENTPGDYEKTLRSWRTNFESGWPLLRSHYGDEFYRMWLYYLGGCISMFEQRLVQLYHIVYSKSAI